MDQSISWFLAKMKRVLTIKEVINVICHDAAKTLTLGRGNQQKTRRSLCEGNLHPTSAISDLSAIHTRVRVHVALLTD